MNTGSNTGSVVATNVIAESVRESLKSGLLLKGTVRAHAIEGSIAATWIAIELPGVGARQVAVHCDKHLPLGQEVMIQCVPNALNPGRYKFQIVTEPPAPAAEGDSNS